jgi:type I restriction enzyme, S subunit
MTSTYFTRLGDFAKEVSRRAASETDLPVYSVTKHQGFVPSLEYFKKQVFSRDTKGYKRVFAGELAYATIHLDEGSIGVCPESSLISPMYTVFSVDETKADASYLERFLKSPKALSAYPTLCKGSVHRRAAISFGRLADLPIPLPSLSEQRRITVALDKVESLRAKRREVIDKLDQLLQSVFLEMFGDPVTNPKGWPIGKISDLLESVKYGTSEKAFLQGEVPVLRMNNITYSGEMNLTDLKYISREKAEEKYLVIPGDILFNRTNSKELVGKTAVYEGPTPMAYAGYLVRARTANGHAPEYISAFMNSSYGKSTLQAMCKSIVGMANINAQEFQAISIPIPPCELQQSFRSHVMAIRMRKRAHELQSQKFDALFSSLQQRSFSGAN